MARNNYIDRTELDQLLKYHSEHYKDENYQISNDLAAKFMLIAKNLLKRPNFSGYSYKTDMYSDAIFDCVRYSKNYKFPGNSFAYLTQISYQSMVRRIKKEKKNFQGKIKFLQSLTSTEIFNSISNDESIDIESFNVFKEMYEKNLSELPITKKEEEQIVTSITKMFTLD